MPDPRKALVTARGRAGSPHERRHVAQVYITQRTIPRNKFFIYDSKISTLHLPRTAQPCGSALLRRQEEGLMPSSFWHCLASAR